MATPKIPSDTKAFFDRLFEEAGFENLSPALRETMYQDLKSRLDEWLFRDMTKHLTRKEAEKFEEMAGERVSQEELQQFLLGHIPDCQNIAAKSLLDFKDTYLGGIRRGK